MDTVFYAEPAYVWAVGLVLFEIMHSRLPFKTANDIPDDYLDTSLDLSPGNHKRHLCTISHTQHRVGPRLDRMIHVYQIWADTNAVSICLLILRTKSMYSFGEEKVDTFECVAEK